jgi:hypothetical protein
MSGPSVPPAVPPAVIDLVINGARDLGRVPTALDAELLLSTLLGGVYAAFEPDRGPVLSGVTDAVAAAGGLVGAVLTGTPTDEVPWGAALGTVRPTGAYAYGDRYGDQTGYLATFAYDDESLGGPEHAVVLLVDHTVGLVTDLVVVAPASALLEQIRTAEDEMTWSAPMELSSVRAAADGYLRATDLASVLPDADSLASNRYLAGARIALLPAPAAPTSVAEPDHELVTAFLKSPEARLTGLARAAGAKQEAIGYALGLCTGFAQARGGDPLRWSPRAVESFLLEWVHGRAVLDQQDMATLPDVLAAWVLWSGRRVGLPDAAVAETLDQIDAVRAEFTRLCTTGERQSPAVRATAQLVAEGVDLADPDAVEAWLTEYNAKN